MELIPWDTDSPEHCNRLYQQRVACGWASDIEAFKQGCKKGIHVYYWLVLNDDFPAKDDMIAKHVAKFPEEKSALQDTATTLWASPRGPAAVAGRTFMPLGHIGLGRLRPDDERVTAAGDSESRATAWVGPLYVSWAIQRLGLGRFAMDEIERLAALPPVNADVVALDAVSRHHALQPELVKTHYEERGFPTPVISNHDWYLKRGYSEYLTKENLYPWTDSKTGEVKYLDAICLRKKLPPP